MAQINADLSSVKDEDMNRSGGGWSVKPDGWYRVMIQKSDFMEPNHKGSRSVFLKHVHCDEPYMGNEEHEYLTIVCPSSSKAQEIATAKLKEIAVAVGHPNPDFVRDTEELHGTPFMIRLYSEDDPQSKYADSDGKVQRIGDHMGIAAYRERFGEQQKLPGTGKAQPPLPPPPYGASKTAAPGPNHIADDDIPF